jgi:hypothetical protein
MNYYMKNRTDTIPHEAAFTMVTNMHYTLMFIEVTYVSKGLGSSDLLGQRFFLLFVGPIAGLVWLEYRGIIEMKRSPERVVDYYGAQVGNGAVR